jgi:hypothetical protein
MQAPDNAKVISRYWFQCAHCGYRASNAHVLLQVPPRNENFRSRLIFWCPKCSRSSVLVHPILAATAPFVLPAIVFAVTMTLMTHGSGWIIPVSVLVIGIAAGHLALPMVFRLTNRYVAPNDQSS